MIENVKTRLDAMLPREWDAMKRSMRREILERKINLAELVIFALLEGDDGKTSLHRKNADHARTQPIGGGPDDFLTWAHSFARDLRAAERTYRRLEREYRNRPEIKAKRAKFRATLTDFKPGGEEEPS